AALDDDGLFLGGGVGGEDHAVAAGRQAHGGEGRGAGLLWPDAHVGTGPHAAGHGAAVERLGGGGAIDLGDDADAAGLAVDRGQALGAARDFQRRRAFAEGLFAQLPRDGGRGLGLHGRAGDDDVTAAPRRFDGGGCVGPWLRLRVPSGLNGSG